MSKSNPLDRYDLPTYNFELSIVNPIGGGGVRSLAKTASSPYYIDDVTIKSVIAPNTETATSLAIEFDFSIKEPNGAYFLQHMQEKAKEIDIDNYMKTQFLITLRFPASHDGKFLSNVVEPLEWRVTIINCDVSIDSSGSTYNMKAVTSNQYATANQYGLVTEAVSIEANNIESFFSQLSTELKKMKRHDHAAHESADAKDDEYIFKFDPTVIGDGSFIPEKAQEELSSFNDAVYGEESWDEVGIHVAENTELTRLMDAAILSTEHFQRLIKESQSPDDNDKSPYSVKQFYIIVPTVEYIDYDNNKQDYVRRFTYEVKAYQKYNLRTQIEEQLEEDSLGKIIKEYEYIFTGKNVDVLNLDVSFNFGGIIPTPKNSGISTTVSSSTAGARAREEENREDLHIFRLEREDLYGQDIGKVPWDVGDIMDTYAVESEDHQGDFAFPSPRHPGRKLASSFWSDALVTRRENMLQIDLEIRGDPDWIRETMEHTISSDVFFSLLVKSPRPSDIEGQWIGSVDMVVLAGYYHVIEITSSFNGGMFTQTLNGIRAHRKTFLRGTGN